MMATMRGSSGACGMPSADRLIRLTATVAEPDVDIAVAEGCGLTGGGCRVADPVEGRVVLDYWVPEATNPGAAAMQALLASVGITTDVDEQVEDDSWKRALRDFHQPVVAGRVRVRPPWVAPEAGMLDVVVDPGMAFGTGQHPTTRTSLELIAEVPRGPVLDAGCGTGVLSIAAARLGFGPITAIDHDPHAVHATEAGARANMVPIDVHQATIGVDPLPESPIVFANLTLEVLRILATALMNETNPVPDTGGCLAPHDDHGRQMSTNPPPSAEIAVPDTGGCLAPGGVRHLVASGLRVHEVDDAVAAFSPLGLVEVRRLEEDGWASVRMAR